MQSVKFTQKSGDGGTAKRVCHHVRTYVVIQVIILVK